MMKDTKQLNLEAFKSLLKELYQAGSSEENEKVAPVLEQMELMTGLLEDYSHLTDAQELEEMGQRIQKCQEANRRALNELFTELGTSYEETQEYFRDRQNFSKNEWENIQNMQQRIQAATI